MVLPAHHQGAPSGGHAFCKAQKQIHRKNVQIGKHRAHSTRQRCPSKKEPSKAGVLARQRVAGIRIAAQIGLFLPILLVVLPILLAGYQHVGPRRAGAFAVLKSPQKRAKMVGKKALMWTDNTKVVVVDQLLDYVLDDAPGPPPFPRLSSRDRIEEVQRLHRNGERQVGDARLYGPAESLEIASVDCQNRPNRYV